MSHNPAETVVKTHVAMFEALRLNDADYWGTATVIPPEQLRHLPCRYVIRYPRHVWAQLSIDECFVLTLVRKTSTAADVQEFDLYIEPKDVNRVRMIYDPTSLPVSVYRKFSFAVKYACGSSGTVRWLRVTSHQGPSRYQVTYHARTGHAQYAHTNDEAKLQRTTHTGHAAYIARLVEDSIPFELLRFTPQPAKKSA